MLDEVGDRGVVYQCIQTAVSLSNRFDHLADSSIIRHVTANDRDRCARRTGVLGRPIGVRFAPRVVDDDVESTVCELQHAGAADSRCGPGHEGDGTLRGFGHRMDLR